jgi:flagellar motor switch protein FliG
MSTRKKPSSPQVGLRAAAELLNGLDPESQKRLLNSIAEKDPNIAEGIKKEMFRFEDIAKLEDGIVQKLVQSVPLRKLALALRGIPDELQQKFFKNTSSRVLVDLKEEMESMGPQPQSQVGAAQRDLVEIARKIAAK